ncbi:MAG: hypothetical protein KGQ60_05900, partial [Planctomycetes bacterium]|nr:hypothetical protein [Planctomycetota bacterium]
LVSNYQLESRMREIRQSGSVGGEPQSNAASLPQLNAGATKSPGRLAPTVPQAQMGRQSSRTDTSHRTSPYSPQAVFDTPLQRIDRNDVLPDWECIGTPDHSARN